MKKSDKSDTIKKGGKAKQKTEATKEVLLDALQHHLGIVTGACKAVGIHRSTFYDWYNSDPEFKEAVDDIDNIALDFAESKLHRKIDKGDTSAIIFYLKTRGKKRGYVEKQEMDITKQGNITIIEKEYSEDEENDQA